MGQQVARVGKYGKSWHLLDSNGRVRCENHMSETGDGISGPYLTHDANGQYRDIALVSEVHSIRLGEPDCHWCLRWSD